MQHTTLHRNGTRAALAALCCLALTLTAIAQVQKPDLIVESVNPTGLIVNPQSLQIGGTVDVTVKNVGTLASPACSGIIFSDRGTLNGVYDAGTDVVHGSFTAPSLAVGASATVSVSVSGQVRFLNALLYAYVDDTNTVDEINEGNNLSNTGFRCRVARTGQFDPQLKWKWDNTNASLPAFTNVFNIPIVADLDNDGAPEVIFGTDNSGGGESRRFGYLRILDGRTGAEKFTNTNVPIDTGCHIAVGDLDGDRYLEIVAIRWNPYQIAIFDYTGTFVRSFGVAINICSAPAIANIDGVGNAEIIYGATVYRSDGSVMWNGSGTVGTFVVGPKSYAVDIDLDGSLDVVAGSTVYNSDGTIKWRNTDVPDGLTAVANFDSDPNGEVVLLNSARLYLLDHDGTLLWQVFVPGLGSRGGPPTVGNFDDDAFPEIGVAGFDKYVVVNHDSTILWSATTRDYSSHVTGSTLFDFEGDGATEVVYTDELYLNIFAGRTGQVLFQYPLGGCTLSEYSLVADADADGSADIVAIANQACGLGVARGIHVFHSRSRSWVPTRSIWNQHAYSITNVNDDGSIPAYPTPNWLVPEYNNFRCNVQGRFPASATPDLTASFLRRCPIPDTNGDFNFVLRIGNGGAGPLPETTITVKFYRGDPDNGGQFLQSVSVNTQTLQPDQYQDVTVPAPSGIVCSDVYAVVDADNAVTECNESNNKYGLYIPIPGDVNVDRIVDDADLLEILFNFGREVGADEVVPADINCDGIVDDADLLIALFNFGEECPQQ